MVALRKYQRSDLFAIERALKSGNRPLYVAPTGSGKTRVALELAQSAECCLYIAPLTEIANQAVTRGKELGFVVADLRRKPRVSYAHLLVATELTAARRNLPKCDLIVADEAHRTAAPTYTRVIRSQPDARLVGMTATPVRLDGRKLTAFDVLIEGPTYRELERAGYLCPIRVFGPNREALDLAGVRIDPKSRDFEPRSLTAKVGKRLIGEAVTEWRKRGRGRPTLAFCVGRAHARATVEAFENARINAAYLDGQTSRKARGRIFDELEAGRIEIVASCGALLEGLDLPFVSCIQVLRHTLSPGLHIQMLGRGSRIAPGKRDCVVLDHAGNIARHGFLEDDRNWTRIFQRKATRESAEKTGVKPPKIGTIQCRSCGRIFSANRKTCPECGFVVLPTTAKGALVEYDPARPLRPLTARPSFFGTI